MHSYNPIILSQPLQSKKLYRKGNVMFRVGAATMQGWRTTMEDTHVMCLSLPKHPDCGFFAVYDGHGGTTTSCYLEEHFHSELDNLPNIHSKVDIIKTAIDIDTKVMAERNTFRNGSTAVFAIVDQDQKHKGQFNVTIGHVGDSRAILIKGGKKGLAITKDHLPVSKRERARIIRAGGVVKDGRVRGELAVSRSFGDAALKLPAIFPPEDRMVTPIPELKTINVTSDDLILLTCDGIYEKDEVYSVESASKFIIDDLRTNDDLALSCARLLDGCLEKKSYDNMTALLIQFKEGTDYHKEQIDYRPGPYHEGARHCAFRKAYLCDAKSAGYTLKQARMKFEETEIVGTTNNKINRPHTVQRRNSESEVVLGSKDKKLSDSGYESDEEMEPKCSSTRTRRKSEHLPSNINHLATSDPSPVPTIELKTSLKDSSTLKKTLFDSNDHQPIRVKSSDELHKGRIVRSLDSDHLFLDGHHSPRQSKRTKSPSPSTNPSTSKNDMRKNLKKDLASHSEEEHLTSENDHHSDRSSNDNSPVLLRNTSNPDVHHLDKSNPKIISPRKHRKIKGHTKTPPDPMDPTLCHISPQELIIDIQSDDDKKIDLNKSGNKKIKPRKHVRYLSHDDTSKDESNFSEGEYSCDHDPTDSSKNGDLSSDSHKKHIFHFPFLLPSFHLPHHHHHHHHKRNGIHHKKEISDSHPASSYEHDTEVERILGPLSSRRHKESEPHPRSRALPIPLRKAVIIESDLLENMHKS